MKKVIWSFLISGIFYANAQDETVNGRLKVNSGADVGRGQNPAFMIGPSTGYHIDIDGNEIGAFNNNNNAVLYINGSQSTSHTVINGDGTGNVGIRTMNPSATLHINSNADVGRGQNPALRVGSRNGNHIAIDDNEIGAFHNNSNAVLYINGSQSTSNTIINGDGTGNVGIGTMNPNGWRLAVKGKIRAEEIKVETGWADYVFQEDYNLPTLEEVEKHIKAKGHLINIPSAKDVAKNGVQLGEMNKLLLEKIEELMLYTLQQEKRIKSLENHIKALAQ
ncbi:hypothetical protein [uncultured Croceitalea sp.]|uniref:hypothetical protein n=1 Tax=uncultured Croceitalea sp. TaxID=1798908 RepID=UPI0033063FD8